jgi:hypothetical protein
MGLKGDEMRIIGQIGQLGEEFLLICRYYNKRAVWSLL